MKKINFYKYLINLTLPVGLFLFLFFMYGIIKTTTKKPFNLEGHWHLTKIEDGDDSSIGLLPTLDFENDSLAILARHTEYGGWGGYHDAKNQTIRIGGECFMAEFSYVINGNQLLLRHQEYNAKDDYYTVKKCDENCCDKQAEYFYYQDINIDLPITTTTSCPENLEKSLGISYYFGTPKEGLSNSKYQLVLGGKISNLKDIKLYIERHKIKVAENKRNRIYHVVYADKNTPMKKLIPLLNYLKNLGKQKVVLATRNAEMDKELIVCLRRVDLGNDNVDERMVLSEWLK